MAPVPAEYADPGDAGVCHVAAQHCNIYAGQVGQVNVFVCFCIIMSEVVRKPD